MRKFSIAAFTLSFVLCGSLLWVRSNDYIIYSDQDFEPEKQRYFVSAKAVVDQVLQLEKQCRGLPPFLNICNYVSNLQSVELSENATVYVPNVMRINESEIVKVDFTLSVNRASTRSLKYNRERAIEVGGGNFETKPAEKRAFILEELGSIDLLWSIKPNSTGTHNLVINMKDAFLNGAPKIEIHGSESDKKEVEQSEFSVEVVVYTIWGITQLQANILGYLIGFIGFILMLPFLKDVIAMAKRHGEP